jgi:chloramphenicol O-acetyltransferase type A
LTHARNYQSSDSVPKITFGKASLKDGKWLLPTSIEVHHGLVDGVHIAQFLEEFQKGMSGEFSNIKTD